MVPSVRTAAEAHRHLQSLAAWRWGAIASAVMSLGLAAAGLLVPAAAVTGVVAAVILGAGAELARTVVLDEWAVREDLGDVPELARARRRMVTDAQRRAMARSLREIAVQRTVPRSAVAPQLLARVAPVRGELLAMAEELERAPRLDPRTMAELTGLITDGARSPLLNEAVPDADYRDALEARVKDVSGRIAAGVGREQGKAPTPPPAGPSAADLEAAARLSPEQRNQMVVGMVEGLAQRLKRDGRDLAGWQRLLKAYTVLGRRDDARAALAEARRNFEGDARALSDLSGLAAKLGLGS